MPRTLARSAGRISEIVLDSDNLILGLLGILIGLYAIRHIIVSVVALALLIGIYWVAYGSAQIYTAIAHRGWLGFIGTLSAIAGIIVIAWRGPSLVTLAIVLGVWHPPEPIDDPDPRLRFPCDAVRGARRVPTSAVFGAVSNRR